MTSSNPSSESQRTLRINVFQDFEITSSSEIVSALNPNGANSQYNVKNFDISLDASQVSALSEIVGKNNIDPSKSSEAAYTATIFISKS